MITLSQYITESTNISDPDELLKLLSNFKYDNFTSVEKYIVKTPKELLKDKSGICYDFVELEREYFTKWNYQFKTFFVYNKFPITDNPTHTFLVFKENNKYYWFEASWQSYKAIHGPFNSYKDAAKYVKKQMKWNKMYVIDYDKPNIKRTSIIKFATYITGNNKVQKI